MSAVKVVHQDLGMAKLKALLTQLADSQVYAGVQGDKGKQPHPNSDATVAEVAHWVHYGTSRIPARPYIDYAISTMGPAISRLSKKAASSIIDGRASSIEEALTPLGEAMVEAVTASIDSAVGWAEPLALSTVKKKGHAAPLVDTGTLRASTSYTIGPKQRGGSNG